MTKKEILELQLLTERIRTEQIKQKCLSEVERQLIEGKIKYIALK